MIKEEEKPAESGNCPKEGELTNQKHFVFIKVPNHIANIFQYTQYTYNRKYNSRIPIQMIKT